ncbi:uncharacterized protein BP01DRAFT_388823 [Aspergillus saccharolyticus JOP 1030-1]|uniref:Uncharacterized protein n=1 Tax=Aspergillus saccharolyticus JOP 1030-1 TaxID=1450539 RepID=A0A318ZN07_9EURO|nr:hypothetical protein BP01DRAFT_388823 [Aspergillus saccharolyticus JOP 1030-1]PYH48991.1 hypothetical protein BP01DRAFT_388823 [Aspergillus saccharolyticus JOP 1030-1]
MHPDQKGQSHGCTKPTGPKSSNSIVRADSDGSTKKTPIKTTQTVEELKATLSALRSMRPSCTPLEALDQELKNLFEGGVQAASCRCIALRSAVLRGQTTVRLRPRASLNRQLDLPIPSFWNTAFIATTVVLLFASPPDPDATLAALSWLSYELGGVPTMTDIRKYASADLSKRFAQAKKVAIDGKVAKVTVLGVDLVDVEIIDRCEIQSRDMEYTSFAHSFVLAIGREGFRIYEAWREHGYRLDQYLMRGGSRLRTWAESKSFLKSFNKLCQPQKQWSPELNSAYEECFGINLDSFCGKGPLKYPIIPVYRPWVRIFEINDVKVEDIRKFTWEGTL